MIIKYNKQFNTRIREIFVGEYFVTKQPEIISTLLGSCVSICLMDKKNGVYGMNHFLLPTNKGLNDINSLSKFGDNSTNLLINRMIKLGAEKVEIKAKIFGGGKVLKSPGETISVNEENIKFSHKYLEGEGIEIVSKDIGGNYGRVIYFDTSNGSVYMRKIL